MQSKETLFKLFIRIGLVALLGLGLQGCNNKKSNRVDSTRTDNNNPFNNGGYNGPQFNNPQFNSTQTAQVQSILNGFSCRQGARLSQVVNFSIQANQQAGTLTTLAGSFQPGSIGGTPTRLYVGVSVYNDVMIVSKITSGSSVIGYNVSISLCSLQNGGFPLIDNSRQLSNFQAPTGIVLDEDNNCGYGSVDSAQNTYLLSDAVSVAYQGTTIQLPPFNVWTSFFKAGCGSNF